MASWGCEQENTASTKQMPIELFKQEQPLLLEYKPQIATPSTFSEQSSPRVAIAVKETLINIQPKVNVFDILVKAY